MHPIPDRMIHFDAFQLSWLSSCKMYEPDQSFPGFLYSFPTT